MRDRMAALRPGLFDEWLAFEALEPHGFPLRNLLQASALATLSNTVGGGKQVSKTKREAYRVDDFLLRTERTARSQPAPRLSVKQTEGLVSSIFAAFGARRA